jgi:hypothetical protein
MFEVIEDVAKNTVKKGKYTPFIIGGIVLGLVFLVIRARNKGTNFIPDGKNQIAEVINDSNQREIQELAFQNSMRFSDLESKSNELVNKLNESLFLSNQNISTQLLDFQSEYRTDLTNVASNVEMIKSNVGQEIQQRIDDLKINSTIYPSEKVSKVTNTSSQSVQSNISSSYKPDPTVKQSSVLNVASSYKGDSSIDAKLSKAQEVISKQNDLVKAFLSKDKSQLEKAREDFQAARKIPL